MAAATLRVSVCAHVCDKRKGSAKSALRNLLGKQKINKKDAKRKLYLITVIKG